MTTPQPHSPATSSSPALAAARSPRTMAARYLAAGTAGIPFAVTAVVICPHQLAVVTAASLAAAAAIVAELPRLYWISAYMHLVKKGTAVAATAADIRGLMTGLADGLGCVTRTGEAPGREGENAECRNRCPGAGQ
jgi:hypothetical protein